MKANIVLIATFATLLAACNNDENNIPNGPVEARVTAGIDQLATRAVNDLWAANDEIGIIVTEGATAESKMTAFYKNVAYKVSEAGTTGTFTPSATGAGIFFQDDTEDVTFSAYYPYTASADAATLPGTAGVITSSTLTQTDAATQASLDYLFASGVKASKLSPEISFTGGTAFKHLMTRLKLTIKTSATDGFAADKVFAGTYKLSGLNHSGQFDVTTGVASTTGTTKTSDWDITGNLKIDDTAANMRTYSMILYPQDVSGDNKLTLKAIIDGQSFISTAIAPNLVAGSSYSYTVTVKKTGLEVSGCTISNWNDGGGKSDAEAIM